jgi:hypothetical protein
VIEHVLAALLGVGVGVLAGLRSVTVGGERAATFDAVPAAVLVVGICIGSAGGITARTHAIFSPKEVRSNVSVSNGNNPASLSALYASETSDCAELVASSPSDLRTLMQLSSTRWAKALSKEESAETVLRRVVNDVCAK